MNRPAWAGLALRGSGDPTQSVWIGAWECPYSCHSELLMSLDESQIGLEVPKGPFGGCESINLLKRKV